MLELSLITLFVGVMIAMLLSRRLRTSMLVGGLVVLFMPFGLLVVIGWILPKALLLFTVIPLRDAVS